MIEHNAPAGAYRKAIYQAIQDTIGRNLTDNEHKHLSSILKLYVSAHAPTESIIQTPLTHEWICTECKDKIIAVGKVEKKKVLKKAIKNRQQIKAHANKSN